MVWATMSPSRRAKTRSTYISGSFSWRKRILRTPPRESRARTLRPASSNRFLPRRRPGLVRRIRLVLQGSLVECASAEERHCALPLHRLGSSSSLLGHLRLQQRVRYFTPALSLSGLSLFALPPLGCPPTTSTVLFA